MVKMLPVYKLFLHHVHIQASRMLARLLMSAEIVVSNARPTAAWPAPSPQRATQFVFNVKEYDSSVFLACNDEFEKWQLATRTWC